MNHKISDRKKSLRQEHKKSIIEVIYLHRYSSVGLDSTIPQTWRNESMLSGICWLIPISFVISFMCRAIVVSKKKKTEATNEFEKGGIIRAC